MRSIKPPAFGCFEIVAYAETLRHLFCENKNEDEDGSQENVRSVLFRQGVEEERRDITAGRASRDAQGHASARVC